MLPRGTADNYRDADYFDLRSELDIMRSMEPHPNIINLLGVCPEVGELAGVSPPNLSPPRPYNAHRNRVLPP